MGKVPASWTGYENRLPATTVTKDFKSRVYDAARRLEMPMTAYIRLALIEKMERDAAS
jgi:hypothetical protein